MFIEIFLFFLWENENSAFSVYLERKLQYYEKIIAVFQTDCDISFSP